MNLLKTEFQKKKKKKKAKIYKNMKVSPPLYIEVLAILLDFEKVGVL